MEACVLWSPGAARVNVVSVWGGGLGEDGVSSLRMQGLSGAAVAVEGPRRSAGAAGAKMATEAASTAACLHDGVCRAADKQWVDYVLPRRPVHGRTGGKEAVLEWVKVSVPRYIL